MPSDRTFQIRPVLNGHSLASALKRLLPQHGGPEVRRLISERHVHLNGNLTLDEARRVKAGDVIKVFQHPRAAPPTEQDVRVRYLDEHLVVVEKPAGITTMRESGKGDAPARKRDRMSTLEEVVARVVARRLASAPRTGPPSPGAPAPARRQPARHPLARRDGPHPRHLNRKDPRGPTRRVHSHAPQVRPVHRLDRDTSGLMIFALSPEAEHALTQMFKSHAVQRKYLAVVHGHPENRTVETWLVRDRGDGLRGSTPRGQADPDAQHAVTHLSPIERVGDYAVVECRLETGRTHQIRIHLSEIGHMLCGEKTYTRPAPGASPVPDRSGAPRQALHSAELHFDHPVTGNAMHFRSPPPPDLSQWLARLRRASP